ncbi:hypothetical protein FDECE_3887 [Fusarium decemcellulare]|nr:hypothetical protein FDECE_3887 [Fusarium decemcellulare]
MSSSDDSSGDTGDSNYEWDLASDDSDSSDAADGEEAEFNDIDGLLPDEGEIGTYVELDGADSDDDPPEDPVDVSQDDSHFLTSLFDEDGVTGPQQGSGGPNTMTQGTNDIKPSASQLLIARQIRALEHRIQRDIAPGIQRIPNTGSGYGTISRPADDDEEWLCDCIHSVLPASLSSTPKYTALPTSSCIRVLCLYPGQKDDMLTATFAVLDLDRPNMDYEALSYRWGPPILSNQPIFLLGKFVHINDALKAIFLSLRLRNRVRIVWADALCINQADMKERRQQVAMMQRIYSQASRVVIYLQGENIYASKCFQAVKDLTSAWIAFHGGANNQSPDRIYDYVVGEYEMRRIAQIFENCYWTRLWMVQEIVSSRFAIVHWNGQVISWTLVGLATTLIRNNKRLWRMFTSIEDAHSARTGLMNAYLMYRLPSARFRSSSMSFLDLLRLTRRFNVSEPLDRIYATLGLPSQQTGPEKFFISPDYRLLRQGLYTRVFHWVVTTHETPLEILSAVRHKTLRFPDFPTWIPQWHIEPIRSIGASHRKGMKFDASAGWPSKPMLQVTWKLNQRSLTLEGFVLGTITSSQQLFAGSLSKYRKKWARELYQFKEKVTTWVNEHVPEGEKGRSMLSLTLTAGQDWYGTIIRDKPALEQHTRCFASWIRKEYGFMSLLRGAPPRQIGDDDEQYGEMVRTVSRGRKLFATTGSRVGLGPEILDKGDIVCLLLGGPVPYVLRPQRNGTFYFVGECYVPGYMNGEAILSWREQSSIVKLRQFVLR